jgi:hypothetical protein
MKVALSLFALATVALAAATAAAQQPVDLQLNLSTQPVYGGYKSPTSSYFGSGDLYTSGNVRAGKALMINRTFLEDKFFSNSSMTRFFRDSVSASDVTAPGYSTGQTQAYFRPGSLAVSGASIRAGSTTGGLSPFGLSYNPSSALPSPFTPITRPSADTAPSLAAPPAIRMQQFMADSAAETTSPMQPSLWSQASGKPAEKPGDSVPTTESMFAPKTPADPYATQTSARPAALTTAPQAQPSQVGLRPMDYLRERFGESAIVPEPEEPGEAPQPAKDRSKPEVNEPQDPTAQTSDLTGAEPAPSARLPEARAISGGRPQRFYEQYMALGIEELKAGMYRPAADAFGKAADFSPLNAWEARSHEAVARLMLRDYLSAAVQLKIAIGAKPDAFARGGAAATAITRIEDWKAVEADLQRTMKESPKAADHALCLAYVLIATSRASEAVPLFAVAEGTYPDTVKALRETNPPKPAGK